MKKNFEECVVDVDFWQYYLGKENFTIEKKFIKVDKDGKKRLVTSEKLEELRKKAKAYGDCNNNFDDAQYEINNNSGEYYDEEELANDKSLAAGTSDDKYTKKNYDGSLYAAARQVENIKVFYELTVLNNFFILDFDIFNDRKSQRAFFAKNQFIKNFWQNKQCLIESTCNGGLHVFCPISEKFVFFNTQPQVTVPNINMVIEFKKSCFSTPSPHYSVLYVPVRSRREQHGCADEYTTPVAYTIAEYSKIFEEFLCLDQFKTLMLQALNDGLDNGLLMCDKHEEQVGRNLQNTISTIKKVLVKSDAVRSRREHDGELPAGISPISPTSVLSNMRDFTDRDKSLVSHPSSILCKRSSELDITTTGKSVSSSKKRKLNRGEKKKAPMSNSSVKPSTSTRHDLQDEDSDDEFGDYGGDRAISLFDRTGVVDDVDIFEDTTACDDDGDGDENKLSGIGVTKKFIAAQSFEGHIESMKKLLALDEKEFYARVYPIDPENAPQLVEFQTEQDDSSNSKKKTPPKVEKYLTCFNASCRQLYEETYGLDADGLKAQLSTSEFALERVSRDVISAAFTRLTINIGKCCHFELKQFNKHINEIQFTAFQILSHIDTLKEDIYGENVKNFLEVLLIDDDDHNSSFSTLANTYLWLFWTRSFLNLIICLESKKNRSGRNSRNETFKDYNLYRRITLRNPVGANITDEDTARIEYMIQKEFWSHKTRVVFNAAQAFKNFILDTLSVVYFNNTILTNFKQFVSLFSYKSEKEEIDFYMFLLFNVKLKPFQFQIDSVVDVAFKGVASTTAVIYLVNQHWIRADSEIFTVLIKRAFPNLLNIRRLVERINMHENVNHEQVKFGEWSSMLPFQNGIFDFDCNQKQTIQNNYKKTDVYQDVDNGNNNDLGMGTSSKRSNINNNNNMYTDYLNENSSGNNSINSDDNDKFKLVGKFSREYIDHVRKISTCKNSNNKRAHSEDDGEDGSFNQDFNVHKFFRFDPEPHDKNFKCFSIFRNYNRHDTVLEPLNDYFNFEDYTKDFHTTNLLSLDNHARYSKEFCIYLRCLLGNNPQEGVFGPFQYQRLLVLMIQLSIGLLRTKLFQNCLNITGRGSNGKSILCFLMSKIFGSKFSKIGVSTFFKPLELGQQVIGLKEALLLYDNESKTIGDLVNFKSFTADEAPILSRGLYQAIDRNYTLRTGFLFCSNSSLTYYKEKNDDEETSCDFAFFRRMFEFVLYNTLGRDTKPRPQSVDKQPDWQTLVDSVSICDNLTKQHGIDLKHPLSLLNLQRGLLFYLLDVLHVFNLSGLSSSNNCFILNSFSNTRRSGRENYLILKKLLGSYVFIDEFMTQDEIDTIVSNNYRHMGNDCCVNLTSFFNRVLPKQKISYNTLASDWYNIFGLDLIDGDSSMNILIDNENQTPNLYFARGLFEIDKMSREQTEMFLNPNNNINVEPVELLSTKYKNNLESYLNAKIPPGHVYTIHQDLKDIFYETVFNLLNNKKVQPLQCPKLQKDYSEIMFEKILESI